MAISGEPPAGIRWYKSSFSASNGCVEVAGTRQHIWVRDTKDDGSGPVLGFTRAEWSAFLTGVRAGEFDGPA